jgi:membrane-anchored glycerophosphoryl diester phosphodiesterase (GDPDase)
MYFISLRKSTFKDLLFVLFILIIVPFVRVDALTNLTQKLKLLEEGRQSTYTL